MVINGFVDFGYCFGKFDLVVEYVVDGFEVFFVFIVEVFGFGFKFLELLFGIDIDGVFGVFVDIEFCFELLGGLK